MTGIHDAQPGDIFVDGEDKLWRVISRCDEPCVHVQEVVDQPPMAAAPAHPLPSPRHKRGGISGLVWKGFKFLHRPAPPKPVLSQLKPSAEPSWLWAR